MDGSPPRWHSNDRVLLNGGVNIGGIGVLFDHGSIGFTRPWWAEVTVRQQEKRTKNKEDFFGVCLVSVIREQQREVRE